uniref:Uncharacterized protein n=1 Tax=Cannabis sativa TaxID=3483 RepID=A0A803PGI3_CANSA
MWAAVGQQEEKADSFGILFESLSKNDFSTQFNLCQEAVEHGIIFDKRKALQEMYRVLKAGSRISVLDFNKSTLPVTTFIQEWMIDNVVVPVATSNGLEEEYRYLKSSIREFLTGKELERLALEVGFSEGRHYEIGGGLMGDLVAKR